LRLDIRIGSPEAIVMRPDEALREAAERRLRPVYLVTGEETYLAHQAVTGLVAAVDTGPAGSLNEDKLMASDTSGDAVVAAARTVPMMARQRLVLVRGLERWESKSGRGAESLDALAAYAADPVTSAVVILVAEKLNPNRKLVRAARLGGWLVSCDPLPRRELPGWAVAHARERGHSMSRTTAELLSELAGPDLAAVADAIERLSLFVGKAAAIDESAVSEVVARLRHDDVWTLVDALAARDPGRALRALRDAYDARDSGLPLLGTIGWRVRQLITMRAHLERGASPSEAAKIAGVAPFKASDTARALRALPSPLLERWLMLCAEADLALKGSRRPGGEVLATMIVEMCG
jgi:DNA polymerase-3 subunit delta